MAGYYAAHTTTLRAELGQAVPHDVLKRLHRKSVVRHLLVAARQFLILGLTTWALIVVQQPVLWIPLILLQGFTVFNFTVLLHEVVHRVVVDRARPGLERLLGLAYAVPSGISATQFTRWHLDHHAELGSSIGDPKRHHLSPKINARWLKFLYCTPALFLIYFRAARAESATYPPEVQRRIRGERLLSMAAHLSVLASIAWFAGGAAALRAYVIPVFFVFPIAFTLNRLGQHYDIDPTDPAKWTSLVRGHWFWDWCFLNSNYHLEHHYFPGVPLYRLPALQRELTPFYTQRGMSWTGYGRLLRGWFIDNRAPHSHWDLA